MLKYPIFRKPLKPGQKGFTMIELLIILAILGMLAGIVVPNVSGFLTTGNLSAATSELQNVKTSALAYKAQNNVWPGDTNDMTAFISGSLHATYTFDSTSGFVTEASGVSWAGITWSPPPGLSPYSRDGEWTKG
jgi:prepilin-type N-terminal cleavage/methylation domain-containing protein